MQECSSAAGVHTCLCERELLLGQGEIPAPWAPPSPMPLYSSHRAPRAPPLLYSFGEPAASWAQADFLRIVLSSQPESAVGLGSLPQSSGA